VNDPILQQKLVELGPEKISGLYKKIFGSEEGRLVLQDLSTRFNPQVPSLFEDVPVDPYKVCFNEGKRCAVFHIETNLLPEIQDAAT